MKRKLTLALALCAAWIAFWQLIARCEIALYTVADILDERFGLDWW